MCLEVQTYFEDTFSFLFCLCLLRWKFDIPDKQISLIKYDRLFPCMSADLTPILFYNALCQKMETHSRVFLSASLPLHSSRNNWAQKKESQKSFLIVYCLSGEGWFLGHQTTSLGATLSFIQDPDVDVRA